MDGLIYKIPENKKESFPENGREPEFLLIMQTSTPSQMRGERNHSFTALFDPIIHSR